MSCAACERDCGATFICERCGRRLNVCTHLVGGFERLEVRRVCAFCRDSALLPHDWYLDLSPSMQRKPRVYTVRDLQPVLPFG